MKLYIAVLSLVMCAACTNNAMVGEKYLGQPYVNNPLGEEVAPDTDPLIRFDAFDCVTFVETALADGDLNKLCEIRYKNGNINFANRNHFIETDWLQNNKDIVENVSKKYGKTAIRKAVINKQKWFKNTYNININMPTQTAELEYIPYSELQEIKNTEPLIVLFVIDNPEIRDKMGTDLAVSHMGFLLPNGKLRHASRNRGRVVDVDFNEYIKQRAKHDKNIGISLVEIKK